MSKINATNKLFKKYIYDENTNFIEIEKKIMIKKNLDTNHTDIELNNYNNTDKNEFKNISLIIFELLNNTFNFSKEETIMLNILDSNKKLISCVGNYCHITYTAQIITNWFFLSLNTDFIDKTFFKKEELFFNKYEIINKINNLYLMYTFFYKLEFNKVSKNKIKHIIFTIINFLIIKNIFEKKNIKLKVNNKKIKTYSFISLKSININNNKINFNIFLEKPTIKIINNTYFLGGSHYSTFYKIFKTNFKSNKHFILNNQNLIDKFCSLEYKIDFNFYNNIYNIICDEFNIDKNETSLENYILLNLNNVCNEKLFNKNEFRINEEEEENEKKIFQQKYNKLLNFLLFTKIKKLKKIDKFFLAFHFDFRGRVYPKSCISPTGPLIYRFLYFYGYYTNNELENIEIINIDKNKKKIIKECLLLKIYNNIDLNDNIQLFYTYQCIFEIGKIFKNELSLQKKGVFNDMDLLNYSSLMIDKIVKNEIKLNFEEKLQYIYILSGLEDLNNNLYKKLILYKDATASGIQLLTIILGANNEETLKYCNLRSYDLWYDTYLYIINIFVKKNEHFLKKLVGINYTNYVKRKDLKRSIMTYIYGASLKTSLQYYLDNLENLDESIGKQIFYKFYDFLDEFFVSTNFFETSSKSILEKAENEYIKSKNLNIKTTDGSIVPLLYFKIIHYRLDRIISKNRNTIVFTNLSNFFDKDKTFRSLIANITQSLDALLLRLIITKLNEPIITIHDSFGIDILRVNYLILIANSSINKIYYNFESEEKKLEINNYYSSYLLL